MTMKTENLISNFEKGNTHLLAASISNVEKQWNPHPKFKGVYLKHIITGGQTDNRFSSHIVKIDPNCILDEHIHDGKTELHEVIEGKAICYLNGTRVIYSPGDCTVIPDNIKHKVEAGENGLILYAKFVPALL
jgi:quercetin dioxygenase-like cupin family protein